MTSLYRRYIQCYRKRKIISSWKFCSRALSCSLVAVVFTFILVNFIFFESFYWRNIEQHQSMLNKKPNEDNPEVERNERSHLDAYLDVRGHVQSLLRHHIDVDQLLTLRNTIMKLGLSSNQTILPYDVNIDRRENISNKETCAIIGSSGILANSGCGHEIDGHEFVIRENLAKTEHFENDVGRRTDLMTSNKALTEVLDHCLRGANIDCYREYHSRLAALNDAYFLIVTFHDWQKFDKKRFQKFIGRARTEQLSLDIRIPNKPIKPIVKALWSLQNDTSSGLMIFTIATTFCDRISLYGFYPFSTGPRGDRLAYHYYDRGSWKGVHNMQSEYQLYQKLHNAGIVRHVTDRCQNFL